MWEYFDEFSALQDRAVFTILLISLRQLITILSEMYFWTRKQGFIYTPWGYRPPVI